MVICQISCAVTPCLTQAPVEERFEEIVDEVRYCKPWFDQVMRENAEAEAWDNY